MSTQTDKLGQPVTVGANVVATFMHGRSHHFVRAKVVGLTPQFAIIERRGEGRRVRFYNTLVIDKLLPSEKAGALNTWELMDHG